MMSKLILWMTGIYELHMVKLIVPIGHFEGYTNCTMNYNRNLNTEQN